MQPGRFHFFSCPAALLGENDAPTEGGSQDVGTSVGERLDKKDISGG